MCGRYTLLADELEIRKAFQLHQPIADFQPSYTVAPGQKVLAIIHDGKERRAGHLQWGLVPSWAKDKKIGYKMINARSETAHEKPSFKNLIPQKRCLIVADSFYEWKKTDETNQPKRIQVKDRNLFTFAGLWDKWVQGDDVLFTCTILTKAANSFMSDIHHRMPIILPKDKEADWIRPEKLHPKDANRFLEDVEVDELTAYNVSSHVNTAKNNDAMCIEPIA